MHGSASEDYVAEDLDSTIRENAAGPKKAAGDSGSVEQHSLKDQIEADRYTRSSDAVAKGHRGLRFSKMVPPGAA
jgi:hypothetical protein